MAEQIYWGGKSEAYLSSFQRDQGRTNNCGEYAVAAALSLLRDGRRLDYEAIVRLADSWTMPLAVLAFGVFGLLAGGGHRLWPGGPTTPRQQANLALRAARERGMKLKAEVMKGTPEALKHYLRVPTIIALVTVGWDDTWRPRIFYPTGKLKMFAPVGQMRIGSAAIRQPFAAHVMLAAAYDETRSFSTPEGDVGAPWGFVNSWFDGSTTQPGRGEIFWMPDEDFRRAWGYKIPGTPNNMVLLSI